MCTDLFYTIDSAGFLSQCVGSRNVQREASLVRVCEFGISADLGSSSNYSNELLDT